jgi:exodeoxyribonuclease VII small subunit
MSQTTPDNTPSRNFEEALSALENRVRKLEAGELPLEEALGLFEEGIELTRECHEKLDAADQKIIELSRDMNEEIQETERE